MSASALSNRVEHVTKESVKSVSTMTSRNKKEYSNDLHELVIKHFLNGDSELEIAKKVLILRDSVPGTQPLIKSVEVAKILPLTPLEGAHGAF